MPRVSLIPTGSSRGGFYREAEEDLKASTKESWGVIWVTKGISVTHGWLCPWEKREAYLYNGCINKAEYLNLTISAAVMFWLHTLLGKFRLGRNRKPKIQLIVAKSWHKNIRLGRNNELVRKCLVAKKKSQFVKFDRDSKNQEIKFVQWNMYGKGLLLMKVKKCTQFACVF